MLAAGRRAGYAPADDPALADPRAALPGAGRPVRLRAAARPSAAGHDPRRTCGGDGRRRTPAGDGRGLERRPGHARAARCRRGPPSIRSLSSSGGGRWWVGPREVRPELEAIAETGATYDSVYALWPCEPAVPQCGWGCAIGPSEATFGAGFSSISTDHWRTLLTDPDPEQGYVHEWLHQVEAVYRALGRRGGRDAAAARCRRLHVGETRATSHRSAARTRSTTMAAPGRGHPGTATG